LLRTCLKVAAAIAGLGATLWVAGPALSTQPFIPEARDFSQPLPGLDRLDPAAVRASSDHAHEEHGRHAEAVFRYESPAVEAPARFDLVGVAGYERELQLRVRTADDPWSEWVTIGAGDPLYTGGSDEVQVRSPKPLRNANLHYVNVSGDTSALSGLLNDVRGTINSAVIGAVGTQAVAASPKPNFVSRREWGANGKGGCTPRSGPDLGKVKAAVVHHTVSVNDYSEAEAPGMVLGICRYHRNANGWNDIGYNALVDRFGNVYQGRAGGMAKPVIGAQAEGHNTQTAGVSTIANHEEVKPSGPERRALTSYLAWRLEKAGVTDALGRTRLKSAGGSTTRTPAGKKIRVKRIIGHQDVNETACPGSYLYDQLGRLRRSVQERMDEYGGTDVPDDGGTDPGGVIPRG
jgi:hypothetical protein